MKRISSPTPPGAPDSANLTRAEPLWRADLDRTPAPTDWLWAGYLAPGHITLLTSPWKAGKTTLLAALLARLGPGGTFAGRPVRAAKAVVVSEEGAQLWRARCNRFDFGSHVCFFCRPFRIRPSSADWVALLDQMLELHRDHRFELAVFDPLAQFLPARSENNADLMLEALAPLERLTADGLAVLLLHHPRKQASADGEWARGSGALSGHADILIEMKYFGSAAADDRRRKLLAYSRFEETPRRLVIELNDAGTDYHSLGDQEDEEFNRGWRLLLPVLAGASDKLTRAAIRADWPDPEPPAEITLYRWLERARAAGHVLRDGTGRKNDPYRYWLPGQEPKWEAARRAEEDPELKPLEEIFGKEWVEQLRRRRKEKGEGK
jgi:hypothetical protein